MLSTNRTNVSILSGLTEWPLTMSLLSFKISGRRVDVLNGNNVVGPCEREFVGSLMGSQVAFARECFLTYFTHKLLFYCMA